MRQLKGDHIIGEIFQAIRQARFKDHAATAISLPGARYPDGAPLSRNMIIQGQSKAPVGEEIGKDRFRQPLHHHYDTGRESAGPYRALDVLPEVLVVFGPAHGPVILPEPTALLQADRKSDPEPTNPELSQGPSQWA